MSTEYKEYGSLTKVHQAVPLSNCKLNKFKNVKIELFEHLYTGMDSMAVNFSLIGRNMENQPTKCTIKLAPFFVSAKSLDLYDSLHQF